MIRLRVPLCVLALSVLPAPAGAFPSISPSVPRLRPLDHQAAMLVARGVQDSPTFRALVDRLARADVIVYIEVGPRVATADGALRLVGATKYARMVHISLSRDLTIFELVGVLGHELHHAVEIADNPDVRNEDGLRRFYRTHGMPGCGLGAYDSEGARAAGHRVRREIDGNRPGADHSPGVDARRQAGDSEPTAFRAPRARGGMYRR